MSKLHIYICLAASLVLASCWHGRESLRLRENAEWRGYSMTENEQARTNGFNISIGIDSEGIFFKKRRCSHDSLRAQVSSEIESANLSIEEKNRAPVWIQTMGPVKYGIVAKVLDVCAENGLKVIGVTCLTFPSNDSSLPSERYSGCALPCFAHGMQCDNLAKFDNVVLVDVLNNGTIQIYGRSMPLADIDYYETRDAIRKITEGKFGKRNLPYYVIRADIDLEIWYVMRAAELMYAQPFVILQGKPCHSDGGRADNESSLIVIGVPRPNTFFWGIDDIWE